MSTSTAPFEECPGNFLAILHHDWNGIPQDWATGEEEVFWWRRSKPRVSCVEIGSCMTTKIRFHTKILVTEKHAHSQLSIMIKKKKKFVVNVLKIQLFYPVLGSQKVLFLKCLIKTKASVIIISSRLLKAHCKAGHLASYPTWFHFLLLFPEEAISRQHSSDEKHWALTFCPSLA